jgi:hypothetical protein
VSDLEIFKVLSGDEENSESLVGRFLQNYTSGQIILFLKISFSSSIHPMMPSFFGLIVLNLLFTFSRSLHWEQRPIVFLYRGIGALTTIENVTWTFQVSRVFLE